MYDDPVSRAWKRLIDSDNKRTIEIQKEAAKVTRNLKEAAKKQPVNLPPIVNYDLSIANRDQATIATTTQRLTWLDKVVFYAAFLFGVIGFGLGFAAMSSLESWWPLVGAGFGAAIGLAIPIAIAALVAKAVYFVKHNWAGIVLVAIVASGVGIAYLVLSAP